MKKSAKAKTSSKKLISNTKTVFSQNFAQALLVLLFTCLLVILYQNSQIRVTIEAINAELRAQHRAAFGK